MQFTVVDYEFSLAVHPFEGIGRLDLNLCGNTQHTLEPGSDLLFKSADLGERIKPLLGKIFLPYLHLNCKYIQIIDAVNHQTIVGSTFLDSEQYALNLRREYVYTPDNKHIIATSHNGAHPY